MFSFPIYHLVKQYLENFSSILALISRKSTDVDSLVTTFFFYKEDSYLTLWLPEAKY